MFTNRKVVHTICHQWVFLPTAGKLTVLRGPRWTCLEGVPQLKCYCRTTTHQTSKAGLQTFQGAGQLIRAILLVTPACWWVVPVEVFLQSQDLCNTLLLTSLWNLSVGVLMSYEAMKSLDHGLNCSEGHPALRASFLPKELALLSTIWTVGIRGERQPPVSFSLSSKTLWPWNFLNL